MTELTIAVIIFAGLSMNALEETAHAQKPQVKTMYADSASIPVLQVDRKKHFPTVRACSLGAPGDKGPSHCSGCIHKKNCSGCVAGAKDESGGWTSLDALPIWKK